MSNEFAFGESFNQPPILENYNLFSVGVPDEENGEEIKAYIVKNPGATATETEIVKRCKANMASYKYPRLVEFRETLPMTATGRILKRELR